MLINRLFEALNRHGVRYVHFKSNLHLDASFRGETDFDLLVRKHDSARFRGIVLEFGAKPRYCSCDGSYSGIEHFLLYDAATEQLHHLHVHYELVFGAAGAKNYCFPDLNAVFSEAIPHSRYAVYIVSPRFELLLLSLRILLKLRKPKKKVRTLLRSALFGVKPRGNMKAELDDLIERVPISEFEQWAADSYPGVHRSVVPFLAEYKARGELKRSHALILTRRLKRSLYFFERASASTTLCPALITPFANRNPVCWLPTGGRMISLIGSDGAGKTTVANDLRHWLRYKLSSETIYLGQAKHSVGVKLLELSAAVMKRLGCKWLSHRFWDYRAVLFARHRRRTWRWGVRRARTGTIVISDRYPLREFWDMPFPMDGPRLQAGSPHYAKERGIYRDIAPYPDLLIVLDIDYETSVTRTADVMTETEAQQRREKIAAVRRLQHVQDAEVRVVNAECDYRRVLKDVKRVVWECLQ